MIEADVVFDRARQWDSYRGNFRSAGGAWVYDIRRVALHEFGHVLGLGHPDEHGETVTAIMNHTISNVDELRTDDVNGARALYGAPVAAAPPSDTLAPGGRLLPGESLLSQNGRYRLLYQSDGNLVLYDLTEGGAPWATNTGALSASVANLQSDGNFVIYDRAGTPLWASGTGGQGAARLVVQTDGNIVLYRTSDGQPIWDRHRVTPPLPRPATTTETLAGTVSGASPACAGSGAGNSRCERHAFTVTASGAVDARLTWSTASTDLDLELWQGGAKIASSDGMTAQETMTATVTPGAYEWRVVYYDGSAAQPYTLAVTRPN